MEEIIENEINEEDIEKIHKLKEGRNVTEFKTYTGPFPVIKPTKKLTEKEIKEILIKK